MINIKFYKLLNIGENEFTETLMELLVTSIKFVWLIDKDNDIILTEILKLSEINIEFPLFVRDLNDFTTTKTSNEYSKSELCASKHHISYIYFAVHKALRLDEQEISNYKDNTIIKSIISLVLKYHVNYLKYKIHNKNKSERFYEKSSLFIIRIIEILCAFEKQREDALSKYLEKLYFNHKDDLEINFMEKINNEDIDSFYIEVDPKKGNFFVYNNCVYNINIQIKSCRAIKKSNQVDDLVQNRNIIRNLKNGYSTYLLLVNQEKENTAKRSVRRGKSNNKIQETQEDKLLEKTMLTKKTTSNELNHEDKLHISANSKRRNRNGSQDDKNDNNNNASRQKKKNHAVSANITKNTLFLQSSYNIPPIEIFNHFLNTQLLINRENNILLYDIIFLIDSLMGIGYINIINLFSNKSTNISINKEYIEIRISDSLFAKHSNEFLSENNKNKIKYRTPKKIFLLIDKAKSIIKETNEIKEIDLYNKNESIKYFDYIKDMIKSYPKEIAFNPEHMWKIILTYIKNYTNEDKTHLFAIGRYQRNQASALAYTSTPEFSQKHNKVIEIIYESLSYNHILTEILQLEKSDFKKSTEFSIIDNWVGSKLAVKKKFAQDFFKNIKKEIKLCNKDKIKNFNLTSIYTRFALSLMIGTRNYKYSIDLSTYSRKMSTLMITEKATTLNAGMRIIPISNKAKNLIEQYQLLCNEMNIPDDNLYLLNKNTDHEIYVKQKALEISLSYNLDEEITKFIGSVPLNVGRHVVMKESVLQNINQTYVETFLGHYSMGTEQLGIYSTLNISDYFEKIKNFINNITEDYQI